MSDVRCENCAMAVFEPGLKSDELLCKRTSKIEKDNNFCSFFKASNRFHHNGCTCDICAKQSQTKGPSES